MVDGVTWLLAAGLLHNTAKPTEFEQSPRTLVSSYACYLGMLPSILST